MASKVYRSRSFNSLTADVAEQSEPLFSFARQCILLTVIALRVASAKPEEHVENNMPTFPFLFLNSAALQPASIFQTLQQFTVLVLCLTYATGKVGGSIKLPHSIDYIGSSHSMNYGVTS